MWLPLLRVEVHADGALLPMWMLLDSGADSTLIPWSSGSALGFVKLKTEPLRYMGGVGGTVAYVDRRVDLAWRGGRRSVRAAWAQTDAVPCLIGRLDFFERLEICFDGRRRRFRILGRSG